MAVKATVDKFGMTFSNAYHRVNRLNYESYDSKNMTYVPAETTVDESGNPVPPMASAPVETWVKSVRCNYEVATYASEETRTAHAEPIYRSNFNFSPSVEEGDLLSQAYTHLKGQGGYEDAIDC